MRRIILRIAADPATPPFCHGERPSMLGILVRERIASLVIEWPQVGFHRIELEDHGVRVEIFAPDEWISPNGSVRMLG